MIARLCVLTTAIFFSISSLVQADEFSIDRIVESLSEERSIDFTFVPTLHTYQSLCRRAPHTKQVTQIGAICDIVLKSPICKKVPKEKRLDCRRIKNKTQVDAWDFLKGCAKGVFESVKTALNFIWEIMKWVWDNATDSEKRTETVEQASEYLNIVKLYLHTEFEKAYDNTSSPFRTVKALKSMSGAMANLILKGLMDLASQKYQELGCLNYEAKSQVVCELASDIVTPVVAIRLIKFGPRVKYTGYKRSYFSERLNTRQELLVTQSVKPVKYDKKESSPNRRIVKGYWRDFYYKEVLTDTGNVDIDHIVPLKHAWDSGAYKWSQIKRNQFANDVENLVVTNSRYNRQKGTKTILEWVPKNKSYTCRYVSEWFRIKKKYDLDISNEELKYRKRLKCFKYRRLKR